MAAIANGTWLSFGRAAGADGASIHRSETVKTLLRTKPGRIHLERLPAYSRATVAPN